MKTIRRHKKIVIVIIAILLCLGYVLNRFVGGKIRLENSAIKKYYGGYYDITPFAERGNVKKECNYFYQDNMAIFTSVSSVLIAEYSENDFKEQKEFLERRKQIDTDIGEKWCKEPFSINNWVFIVDGESEPAKNLIIFGFNEKKNKIAYIKFNDNDLDDINESPKNFFAKKIKYIFI